MVRGSALVRSQRDGGGKVANLTLTDDGGSCEAELITNINNVVTTVPDTGVSSESSPGKSIYIFGNPNNCKLMAGTIEVDLSAYTSEPNVVTGASLNSANVVLTLDPNNSLSGGIRITTGTTDPAFGLWPVSTGRGNKNNMISGPVTISKSGKSNGNFLAGDTIWIFHSAGVEKETLL